MNKVKKVIWFNASVGSIGIILYDNGDEKKVYIKNVLGTDEQSDIHDIVNWGSKILLNQAQDIIDHLKPVEKEVEKTISDLNQINTNTEEGKMLLAAITKITTENQTNKTPDQVISQLNELKDKMDF